MSIDNLQNTPFKIEISPEMQKEYLSTYGWPSWPPKQGEIPTLSEWWKKPIAVYPKGRYHPSFCLLSVCGTPHAGKSTISEQLSLRRKTDAKQLINIIDQDILYRGTFGFTEINYEMLFPSEEDEIPGLFEKNDWSSVMLYQIYKEIFWRKQISDLFSQDTPGQRQTILAQREASVDQILFSYSLLSHMKDEGYTVPPEQHDFAAQMLLKSAFYSQTESRYVDAVVMVGTSQEVAQKRRKNLIKSSKGIADSPFYYDYSAWNGYWIENVWPKTYQKQGTGLLVLNSEDPIDKNIEILDKYVNEVEDRVLPTPQSTP